MAPDLKGQEPITEQQVADLNALIEELNEPGFVEFLRGRLPDREGGAHREARLPGHRPDGANAPAEEATVSNALDHLEELAAELDGKTASLWRRARKVRNYPVAVQADVMLDVFEDLAIVKVALDNLEGAAKDALKETAIAARAAEGTK